MIKEAISLLVKRESLTRNDAAKVMQEIMEGEATPAQIAAFVTALAMKGETVEEVTGLAETMREKSVKVYPNRDPLVDTCGTGGDKSMTFNISTCAAFIAAGGGIAVAKHGNRAATSPCGSADVLESLGVNINLPPEAVAESIETIGIGFLFAPGHHPAMKHAASPRKEIGIRTVFNILGPLTNPAGAKYQVIGVFSPDFVEIIAGVLRNLGAKRAMVVHGLDGLDEISTIGRTKISELSGSEIKTFDFDPESIGLPKSDLQSISGGASPAESGELFLEVLNGKKNPRRDIALLNAGAAFVVTGKAEDLRSGFELAAISVDSGAAMDVFNQYRSFSRRFAS